MLGAAALWLTVALPLSFRLKRAGFMSNRSWRRCTTSDTRCGCWRSCTGSLPAPTLAPDPAIAAYAASGSIVVAAAWWRWLDRPERSQPARSRSMSTPQYLIGARRLPSPSRSHARDPISRGDMRRRKDQQRTTTASTASTASSTRRWCGFRRASWAAGRTPRTRCTMRSSPRCRSDSGGGTRGPGSFACTRNASIDLLRRRRPPTVRDRGGGRGRSADTTTRVSPTLLRFTWASSSS